MEGGCCGQVMMKTANLKDGDKKGGASGLENILVFFFLPFFREPVIKDWLFVTLNPFL